MEGHDALFAEIIAEHCKNNPSLVKKVQDFCSVRKEICDKVRKINEEKFNCMIHNDAWCNNFMFR